VNSLRETVSKDIKEDEINRIQMEVKKKLNEIIKEKNKIDNASEALKNMGKFLMLTKFSIVMDEIQSNVKKVREEEKNAEKKFIESENIQKNILDDLKKVGELQNLLIHNLDEDSINGSIEKIILIKDRTESNSENINMLLTEVEKHKETSSLYLNNTIRGREKIEYLKKHDNDETQNITEAVMQNINNYVHESENCSKNAERHAQETSKNYTLSLEYTKEMNDLLKDSLILAEKMKVEMKKNYVTDMLIEIQDSYYDNKYILERLKERLIKINQEDINMKCEYEANNEKSIDAFTKIQITRITASDAIRDIEKIKSITLDIINVAENEIESFYTVSQRYNEDPLDELKIEKDNFKKILEILNKIEQEKKKISTELFKIKEMERKISNIEDEMKMYKKYYEEGILEEIKKIADQEEKNIKLLKKSINLTIGTSVSFFEDSWLREEHIMQIFKNFERKMNEIYDAFDESYKDIEKAVSSISVSFGTYNDVREKNEKAKIEKEKLKELNQEMKQLLININDAKKNETLRLILHMKYKLDEVNKKAEKEYLELNEHTKDIKRNVQNMIYSKRINTALIELDNAKNKNNEFKKRKIAHSSYKDKSYFIYNEMLKATEFINMNIDAISSLKDYKNIQDTEDIVLSIQGDSFNIESKEKENEKHIINMKNVYEKIKTREELKKKIKGMKDDIDKLLCSSRASLEKYKKIKGINIDIKDYNEILKNSKEYHMYFKEMTNSYIEKYNKMEMELKTNEMTTELNKYKDFLNDLTEFIERLYIEKFTLSVIGKLEDYINIIQIKVVEKNNNILENNVSFYELLELRKKCKLYFLSLVITAINTEISKDTKMIEKKKNYIIEYTKYVINSYDSINNDINKTNELFSINIISSYKSDNIQNSNKFAEEFKIEEQIYMEIIDDIQNKLLRVEEKKNSISVDKNLQELQYLYKEFKRKKKYFKNIYKKINEIKLKEMENTSKKYIDIAESYENIIENEKKRILGKKNYLEKIEHAIRENQELLCIEYIDTKEKMQKIKEVYEYIINIVTEVDELENHNNSENDKFENYNKQISYLIRRASFLLKDTELYQNEKDHDLSEEENMEILNEVNKYIKRTKSNIKKFKMIFENIRNSIDQNKEFVHECSDTILSIYNIVNSVNNIIENYEKELIEKRDYDQIKIYPNEIIKTIYENKLINNNNGNNSQHNETYIELSKLDDENEKSKFDNSQTKLTIGILIGLIMCYSVVISILYKYRQTINTNKKCDEHKNSDNSYNFYKKEEFNDLSSVKC
ncbi:reticulocyte binding protein, putative, partial [Plasmodium relictum]